MPTHATTPTPILLPPPRAVTLLPTVAAIVLGAVALVAHVSLGPAAMGYRASLLVLSIWLFPLVCCLPLFGLRTLVTRPLAGRDLLLLTAFGLTILIYVSLQTWWHHAFHRMVFGRIATCFSCLCSFLWLAHHRSDQRLFRVLTTRGMAGASIAGAFGLFLLWAVGAKSDLLYPFLADLLPLLVMALPFLLAGTIVQRWDWQAERRLNVVLADWCLFGMAGIITLITGVLMIVWFASWAIITVLGLGLLGLLLQLTWYRQRGVALGLVVAALAIGIVLLRWHHTAPSVVDRPWRPATTRAVLATAWEDHLLGRGHYGFSRLHEADNEAARFVVAAGQPDIHETTAHNLLFDLLLDGGLPALALAALALWLTWRRWRRIPDRTTRRYWAIWGCATLAVVLFTGLILTPMSLLLVAIGGGALWAAGREDADGPSLREPIPLGWFALPGLLIVIIAMVHQGSVLLARTPEELAKHAITDDVAVIGSHVAHLPEQFKELNDRNDKAVMIKPIIDHLIRLEGRRPRQLSNLFRVVTVLNDIPDALDPAEYISVVVRLTGFYPTSIIYHLRLVHLMQLHPQLASQVPEDTRRHLEIMQGGHDALGFPHRDFTTFDEAVDFHYEVFAALQQRNPDDEKKPHVHIVWPQLSEPLKRLLQEYSLIEVVARNVADYLQAVERQIGQRCGWEPVYLDIMDTALQQAAANE